MQSPPECVYTDRHAAGVYYDMKDVAGEIRKYPLTEQIRLTKRTLTSTIKVINRLFHSEELWRRFGKFPKRVTNESLIEKAGNIENGIKAFLSSDTKKATAFAKTFGVAALAAFFLVSEGEGKHLKTLQEILNSL